METNYPLIQIPKRINKQFLMEHPEWCFIYSSSVHKKVPYGQNEVCWNFSNCYPMPVRWSQCQSSGWFSDNDYRNIQIEIDVALFELQELKKVNPSDILIIPFPKIGEGRSRMFEFAPRLHKYMKSEINKIAYPNLMYI